MDNKKSWRTAFSTACIAFGIHVGGGFATGNQTVQFFIRFGWVSIFMPIVAVIIMNLVFRAAFISALKHGDMNYHDWSVSAFQPFGNIISVIFEIAFIIIVLIATATSIAGAGSVLVTYGVNYFVAIVIASVVFFICVIWGRAMVAKISTVMSIIIVTCSLIIYVMALTGSGADLGTAASTSNFPFSWGAAIWSMLVYVGYQSYTGANLAAYATDLGSVEAINKFTIINTVINGAMLGLSSIVLLAWSSVVSGSTVPILEITNYLSGAPVLHLLYAIALCLAFVSTGVGCLNSISMRLENKILKKQTPIVRRSVTNLLVIAASLAMSTFGLTALVAKGYGYLGKIGVFLVIIPCLTFITIRNRKGTDKGSSEQEK